MKRGDKIAAILSAAALIALSGFALAARQENGALEAEITQRGEVIERVRLDGPEREITVRSGEGFNIIKAGGGSASVVSSDCPDKVCILHGRLTRPGESAVCLPHRVSVRITGNGGEVEAVSW